MCTRFCLRAMLAGVLFFAASTVASAQNAAAGKHGTLSFSGKTKRNDLDKVIAVDVSNDGKHVYAASYQARAVTVFSRNQKTGQLQHVQTVQGINYEGAACARVSPNDRYVVTASFRADTVSLFERDKTSGKLTLLDTAKDGLNAQGLDWAIDAVFDPMSQFVYVISSQDAAVVAFQITPQKKLKFLQANFGQGKCFNQARGIAGSPGGRWLYVTSSTAKTFSVLERDPQNGKTKIIQIFTDEVGNIHGLAGAFSVDVSPDGKYVYVSAGRFTGDNAVSVYRKTKQGPLEPVQELFGGKQGLPNFAGGNEIKVSPDGRNVYVCGTKSNSLVCFQRDGKTGKLTFLQSLIHNKNGVGPLAGIAGVAISPDGRHLYAAAEFNDTISVFNRLQSRK